MGVGRLHSQSLARAGLFTLCFLQLWLFSLLHPFHQPPYSPLKEEPRPSGSHSQDLFSLHTMIRLEPSTTDAGPWHPHWQQLHFSAPASPPSPPLHTQSLAHFSHSAGQQEQQPEKQTWAPRSPASVMPWNPSEEAGDGSVDSSWSICHACLSP